MSYRAGSRFQRVIDLAQDANFNGDLFEACHHFIDIPPLGEVDIIVETTTKNLFVMTRHFTTTSDRMDLDAYFFPTYTGGTPVPSQSLNLITPQISTLIALHSPVVTDPGIFDAKTIFLGSPDNAANKVGGSFTEDLATRIFPPGACILLRFINQGTVDMEGIIRFEYFERDTDEPIT